MNQKTLVFAKPDGTVRRYAGARLVKAFIDSGFSFEFFGEIKPNRNFMSGKHYVQYADKPFFRPTIEFVTSSPIVTMIVVGEDVVSRIRKMIGPTFSDQAPFDTLRGRYGLYKGVNLCHASDEESAEKEVKMWMDEVIALDKTKDYNKLASEYVKKYIDFQTIDVMRYRELIKDMLDKKIRVEDLKIEMFSLIKKESDFDEDTIQLTTESIINNILS